MKQYYLLTYDHDNEGRYKVLALCADMSMVYDVLKQYPEYKCSLLPIVLCEG